MESPTTQKNALQKRNNKKQGEGKSWRCSLVRVATSALVESAVGMPSVRLKTQYFGFVFNLGIPSEAR